MLNVDLATNALEYLYANVQGGVNIGNPQPFVNSYQNDGAFNTINDFNNLMLAPTFPAINIDVQVGLAPVTGDAIRNQVQATAIVGKVINNGGNNYDIELLNAQGAWNNLNNATWFTTNGNGNILAFNPNFSDNTLQYIFYGDVTCSSYSLGEAIPNTIELIFYNELQANNPLKSLSMTRSFPVGFQLSDSMFFKTGGVLVQELNVSNHGSVSFDGYLFAIESQN